MSPGLAELTARDYQLIANLVYVESGINLGAKKMQLVRARLGRMITFARFNLMTERFPFRHGFQVVFLRNVMIYFDQPTQQTLVNKTTGQLQEGGYLVIGPAESLKGIDHSLSYVEPTVYRKPEG